MCSKMLIKIANFFTIFVELPQKLPLPPMKESELQGNHNRFCFLLLSPLTMLHLVAALT